MPSEELHNQKSYDQATVKRFALLFLLFVIFLGAIFISIVYYNDKPDTDKNNDEIKKPEVVNEKTDNTTPTADSYFQNAPRAVYQLVRKIEKKQPITLDEVKALPEGTLNARYGHEITLLFAALVPRNLQAIDVLLQAGADPYVVDYPSKGSARDFTYFTATVTIVKPDFYVDKAASKKFRYQLTEIYLKNGGRADHIIPGKNPTSLVFMHALNKNYKTVKLLIDHGADPLFIDSVETSVIMALATDYNDESLNLLKYIVCKGYYKQATLEQVKEALIWFAPSGPKDAVREQKLKTLSMLVLRENPEYKDDRYTREIFAGPIPWKEILDLKTSEVCHAK